MHSIIYLVLISTATRRSSAIDLLKPWLTSEPNAADIRRQTRLFILEEYIYVQDKEEGRQQRLHKYVFVTQKACWCIGMCTSLFPSPTIHNST
jgi:hypothetical protein